MVKEIKVYFVLLKVSDLLVCENVVKDDEFLENISAVFNSFSKHSSADTNSQYLAGLNLEK